MARSGTARALLAGVARVVITPPLGIRMCGYTVQEDCAHFAERELTATALVLTDGDSKAVLLACDILFIQSPHVERIRERIGQRLNMPGAKVLINASHTHLGPTLPGWQKQEDDAQARLQESYLAFLQEALVGVAALADERRQPARIGAGRGTAPLGMNRRERLPDGKVIIGENPQGAVDRDVSVLRLDDLAGKPIATVMSAAAHTVVLGPRSKELSPDYVGPARQIVESATGAPALFFQGAAGNINPACGIGSGGLEQYDDLHRLGAMLGGETLKVWAQIRTHNRRGPRRIVQSVATVSVWDYEPTPEACVTSFALAERTVTLALAALPERDAAQRQHDMYRKAFEEAKAAKKSRGALNVARRLHEWSELVLRAATEGKRITRDLYVWGLGINDIGIVAVNGEPFAELSLEVKRQSPFAHTIFLGYSNGCLGYLPTPEAFAEGGMEVEESVKNYHLPAQLTVEWGPAVVRTALEVLKEVRG